MKFLICLCLAVASVVAEPGVSEWRAEYGAYPTGLKFKLNYDTPIAYYDSPMIHDKDDIRFDINGAPLYDASILKTDPNILKYDAPIVTYDPSILKYDAPKYYRLAPKAYSLPAGYRVSYDPENFNEAFGFYPDYKK